MKFSIKRQKLMEELSHVLRAIPAKATLEILTGIKLELTTDHLILMGSDAAISIKSTVHVEDESFELVIEESGSVVLPARLLNDVIRRLPTDTVHIRLNPQDHSVIISSGKAQFVLSGTPGNSYPKIQPIEDDFPIQLPTILFRDMINQTIFSASNQETRPILTGIHLQFTTDRMIAVATDSHRLSRRIIPIDVQEEQLTLPAITIPKKTVKELSSLLEDDHSLYLTIGEQQLIFTLGHLTVYSRLLEGNYPPTDRLIPEDYLTLIRVNRHEFMGAIDRAALIAHEGKNMIVQLDANPTKVELSVPGNEASYVAEEIIIHRFEGEGLRISFNPNYMKDALRSFEDEEVNIQFLGPERPILLTPIHEEDPRDHLIQLLTPVRTHYM